MVIALFIQAGRDQLLALPTVRLLGAWRQTWGAGGVESAGFFGGGTARDIKFGLL